MQSSSQPVSAHPPRSVRRYTTWLALTSLLLVCTLIVVLGCLPQVAARLYFHPAQDALWRGLPAQLIHLNTAHLLLNLLTLIGCMAIAEMIQRLVRMPWVLLGCALAVCIGLRLETPPLAWYVGLSGALYGIGAWLTLELSVVPRHAWVRMTAFAICILIGAKAILGIDAAGLLGGLPVARQAHVYGYIGGILMALPMCLRDYYERRASRRAA